MGNKPLVSLLGIFAFSLLYGAPEANALPELDLQTSVVVDGVTVNFFPDSPNPNLFYFMPTTMELAPDVGGGLKFGFHHWGITKADPLHGVGGNATFTIQPSWDKALIAKATAELRKTKPQAVVSVIPIEKSYWDLVVANSFANDPTYVKPSLLLDDLTIKYSQTLKDLGITATVDQLGDQAKNVLESIAGAGGTGPQAFSVDLNDLGGRLSAATPGARTQANYLGARYRFMVKGVTPKFRAELTVHWRKTYEHFRATVSGGYWFVSGSNTVDIQSMRTDGSIELKITAGAVDEKNETLLDTIFQTLVSARINGTGMFTPELRPSDVGGGGGNPVTSFIGWGFNENSGFQRLDESVSQTFIIDKQNIQERAYSIGSTFGLLCKPGSTSDYFVNLSQPSKPCPDDNDIDQMFARINVCWDNHKSQLDYAKTQSPQVRDAIEKQVIRICSGPSNMKLNTFFSVQ
jgi:hypothetical protein